MNRRNTFHSTRSLSMHSRKSSRKSSSLARRKAGLRNRTPKAKWKWIVRKVISNLEWLADTTDVPLGDNPVQNAYVASHRKEGQILSLEDKLFFKKPREYRTREALDKVTEKLQYFKAFREYSPKVRDELLMRLDYMYLEGKRVIVRQDREAGAMYFIVIGSVEVDHAYPDPIFNDETLHNLDKYGYGDSFGEIPLFYGEPHRATITVLEPGVEMLVLNKTDFKIVLEESLSNQWGSIRWAMTKFPYFERWPEDAVRYLCCHSILITTPSDVLVPVKDVNGLGIAVFILEGTVRVIQRMLVTVNTNEDGIKKRYTLCPDQSIPPTKLPQNVIPFYMQTVKLRRNAVFGLGEQMSKHTMMTETDTLLMICPRFIIDRYNIVNVWTRVVGILNYNHPKIEKVFEAFIQNRMWARNRKQFSKSIKMPQADKNMTIHNTPLSSRAMNCTMKDKLYKKITSFPEYKEIIKQMKISHQRQLKNSAKGSTIVDEEHATIMSTKNNPVKHSST
uniref:Cyclic nucleotide-binding domain-containing protein n=1 Tax=Lygus hesperus TaxID=30085 RepID=A0A0A9WME2_LYGHE